MAAGQIGTICNGPACLVGPAQGAPYDLGPKHTYDGLVPRYRTTSGLATVPRTAFPAAAANTTAAAIDPLGAPIAASDFRLAMGVVPAHGCAEFQKVCVYVCVLACV